MFSVSHVLCGHRAGNEPLRYGHRTSDAQREPRPVVVWAVTAACNLRCVHCYASANACPRDDELTHEEGRTLLRELADYGVPAVLFSGGEPLMRHDTVEWIRYARSLGLACTLSTNGLLIDEAMAARLARSGLRYVGISLDGMGELHDRLRGRAGAFEQTLAAIRRCKEAGLKVGVRFTVHRLNADHLQDIVDVCVREGVDRLCVYHLAYAGRGMNLQRVDLTHGQTRRVVRKLFTLTRRLHEAGLPLEVLTVGNHADAAFALRWLERFDPARAAEVAPLLHGTGGNRSGQSICSIDPRGDVHIDQFCWHHTVGNLRHLTFREVWARPTDPLLRRLRQRPQGLPERCRGCRYVGVCNGNLRGRAHAATGDWMGPDPSCYLRDEEVASPREEVACAV